MNLYAIVDKNNKIVKHLRKGSMAIFSDLEMLKKHMWRYTLPSQEYKIAELEITKTYDWVNEE